jgi:eukaryotic-like serine/threonine-protein kinase
MKVAPIFEAALEREPSLRPAFIDEACGDDHALRQEVDSLLAGTTPVILDQPMPAIAAALLEPGVMLADGAHLGPYRIQSLIGEGGMGQVYRAFDTRLNRTVAVKVLPSIVAHDSRHRARFEQEAQTVARFAHPHICAIYDVGHTSVAAPSGEQEIAYLVLEYLEGQTLAQRLEERALRYEEALRLAIQIGNALEAAHRRGIVHRDLKPANVFLVTGQTATACPIAKLLDFGLAGPSTSEGGDSAGSVTVSVREPTGPRSIRGTLDYMAPEQIEGREADNRSDIFAFGAVLWEMFSGRKAVERSAGSEPALLANAGSKYPAPIHPLAAALLERIVKKCLAPDRDERWQNAGDMVSQLDWLLENGTIRLMPSQTDAERQRRRWTTPALLAIAIVAIIAVGWLSRTALDRDDDPTGVVTRFEIPVSKSEFVTDGRNFISLSRDGKALAYAASSRINIRLLDRLDAMAVRGAEGGPVEGGSPVNPFFSPDGRWIGFFHQRQIKKVPIEGGRPVPIRSPAAPLPPAGIAWQEDGTILAAEGGTVLRFPDSGGEPAVLVSGLKGFVQSAELLPDNRTLLLSRFPEDGSSAESEILLHSLDTGREQVLIRGGIQAQYVSTGHIVYFDRSTLSGVRFDLRTLTLRGSPMPVVEDVATGGVPGRSINTPGSIPNVAHFAISRSGTLAYLRGSFIESSPRNLVWVDRLGHEVLLGAPTRPYSAPRISPNGRRVAVTIHDRDRDIWIWDGDRKALTPFTRYGGQDRYSEWTADGTRLLFASDRGNEAGLWVQASDGTGTPTSLARLPRDSFTWLVPTSVRADGTLVATAFRRAALADVWLLTLTGTRAPSPLLATTAAERNGELSPDGRWLAYESRAGDRFEVYVRPFPDIDRGVWQVSHEGGTQPRWAPDGRELFFLDAVGALSAARFEGTSLPPAGPSRRILESRYVWRVPTYEGRMYDVSSDGKRFLMLKATASDDQRTTGTSIVVVQNWFQELKRLLP